MTEADASIGLALRGLAKGTGVGQLHLHCNIHNVSNAIRAVISPMEGRISALVNLKLPPPRAQARCACSGGGGGVLREVFRERLLFSAGLPCKVEVKQNRAMANVCTPATGDQPLDAGAALDDLQRQVERRCRCRAPVCRLLRRPRPQR